MTTEDNSELETAEEELIEAMKAHTEITQRARACICRQAPCGDDAFPELMKKLEAADSRVRKALEGRYMLNRYRNQTPLE